MTYRRRVVASCMMLSVFALGACGSAGDKPAAAGDGAASTAPAASPGPSSPGPTVSTTTVAPGTPVVGPTGYGNIRLGMSEKQALATGMLGPLPPHGRHYCAQYPFKGGTVREGAVLISPDAGVVMIVPPRDARTPQGIGIGSTLAQVTAVYPDLGPGRNGSKAVQVPHHQGDWYEFSFDGDAGKVVGMSLGTRGGCAN